jgi:hypothetical protein
LKLIPNLKSMLKRMRGGGRRSDRKLDKAINLETDRLVVKAELRVIIVMLLSSAFPLTSLSPRFPFSRS